MSATLITTVLFYAFAAVLVVAALGVVTSRNPVHSAFFLVLAFFQSSMLWLLLEAEFLAVVLVLVYVGAVMVLFLFVVMMLDINVEELRHGYTRYLPLGLVVASVVHVHVDDTRTRLPDQFPGLIISWRLRAPLVLGVGQEDPAAHDGLEVHEQRGRHGQG